MASYLFDIPPQVIYGQLLLGLINGAFYAMMSLGLAIIFGMLNVINFAHGAQYMLGAFLAYLLLQHLGIGYWPSLVIVPLLVGALGILMEKFLLKRLYKLEHLYGLLLTLGVAIVVEGTLRALYGSSGMPYQVPPSLSGAVNLGFMRLPIYRGWVIVFSLAVCLLCWLAIEHTRLGALLRASTENPKLVRTFGVNVPRMITLTYGFGVMLAGLAGVMAAPVYSVNPQMGSDLIVVIFAIVVIGGMGSILGAIATGFGLGILQGLTKLLLPVAADTIIFVLMAVILLVRPNGLFGKMGELKHAAQDDVASVKRHFNARRDGALFLLMLVILAIAPFLLYPMIVMKALCFGLVVLGFNQLLGYTGLVSFGHAMFLGWGGYIAAYAAKYWGMPPELCLVIGGVVGAALGLSVGSLAIRRQGIYFAMITLAFAQMFYFFALRAPFTGGEDGLQAVPRGTLLGLVDLSSMMNMYMFVTIVFLAGFLIVYRIIHSPFGEVLVAIRENEQRAISLGYDTARYKLLAFVLSATIAGVAGALKVLTFQLASLSDVHWSMSGDIILMALVGGIGTIFGPILGAAAIVGLQNYLSSLGMWVPVVQGAVFIASVLVFRRGIAGGLSSAAAWVARKRRSALASSSDVRTAQPSAGTIPS